MGNTPSSHIHYRFRGYSSSILQTCPLNVDSWISFRICNILPLGLLFFWVSVIIPHQFTFILPASTVRDELHPNDKRYWSDDRQSARLYERRPSARRTGPDVADNEKIRSGSINYPSQVQGDDSRPQQQQWSAHTVKHFTEVRQGCMAPQRKSWKR